MHLKEKDVSRLLESLSKAERKSLTLFLQALPQKKKNYLNLLESIKKKGGLATTPPSGSPQALTNAKRALYRNALKSLRNHHDEKSIDILISNYLVDIELLYDLGLPDQALVRLQKAYKKASQYEKHGLLLQIFEWERKLNIVLNRPCRSNQEIEKEEQTVLSQLNETLRYKNAFAEIKLMKRRYGYIKNLPKERQLMKKLIRQLPALTAHASQKATYYYHHLLAIYNWMLFNHTEGYKHSRRLLSEDMREILSNEFLDGVLEHITSCACVVRFEEAMGCMDIADAFIAEKGFDQSPTFLLRTFYFKIIYKLLILYYSGDLIRLQATVEEAENKLVHYDKQFSTEMKQVIYSNLKNAYAVMGMVDKADKIVESTLTHGLKATRKDMYDDAMLFKLFLLIQTETYVLLPSAALAAQRYFKQFIKNGKVSQETEYEIALLFRKDCNWHDKASKDAILKQAKDIFRRKIENTTGLDNFQEFYTYFIIWIDSLINGRPFHEEAKVWYHSFNSRKTIK